MVCINILENLTCQEENGESIRLLLDSHLPNTKITELAISSIVSMRSCKHVAQTKRSGSPGCLPLMFVSLEPQTGQPFNS